MTRVKPAPLVSALLGPIAVITLCVTVLASGGPPPPGLTRQGIDASLAESDDVVVLGNSTSRTDLDYAELARTLGVPRVAGTSVAGSGGPTWLAVLDARVFQAGHHPRLILVYAPLEQMLASAPTAGPGLERLEDVLGGSEGIAAQRGFQPRSGVYGRLASHRARLHAALLEGVRDAAVGLAFGGTGDSLLARGASVAGPAMESLFGGGAALRVAGAARVMPVQETDASTGAGATAAQSVMPDLIRLAHENGSRIVIIRGPDRPGDIPGRATQAEGVALLALANRVGAGFVDLSYVPAPPSVFRDNMHMNAIGRAALMEALVAELERLDPLGPDPMPPAITRPHPVGVRREGTPRIPSMNQPILSRGSTCRWLVSLDGLAALTPASLAAAGLGAGRSPLTLRVGDERRSLASPAQDKRDGCAPLASVQARGLVFTAPEGATPDQFAFELSEDFPLVGVAGEETWWVYPGTHAVVEVSGGGASSVSVAGRRIGDGPAGVSVGGQHVDIPEGEALFTVTLPEVEHAETWSIEVESEGPFVALEAVSVTEGGRSRDLLGGFDAVLDAPLRWALGAVPLEVEPRDGGYTNPMFERVDQASLIAAGVPTCSPYDVTVGGAVLGGYAGIVPPPGAGPRFSVHDGLLRVNREGEVRVALRGVPTCAGGAWLYPGQTGTSTLRAAWSRMRVGATAVVADLRAIDLRPDDTVHMRLSDSRRVLVDQTVDAATLEAGPVTVPLDPPFTGPVGRLSLVIENASPSGFVFVRPLVFRDPTATR